MFESFTRGEDTKTICTNKDVTTGNWMISNKKVFVMLYNTLISELETKLKMPSNYDRLAAKYNVRMTWTWEPYTDMLLCMIGGDTNKQLEYRFNGPYTSIPSCPVLRDSGFMGRQALESLGSLTTDIAHSPGPMITYRAEGDPILDTRHLSSNGYRNLADLKRAVQSQLKIAIPHANIVEGTAELFDSTIVDFACQQHMTLHMHRRYLDYECKFDHQLGLYRYRIYILINNPCDSELKTELLWTGKNVNRVVSNIAGLIDKNKQTQKEIEEQCVWDVSHTCVSFMYDMRVDTSFVDDIHSEGVITNVVSLQQRLASTEDANLRLFMVRIFRHYHHHTIIRHKSCGTELLSWSVSENDCTSVCVKTIDRQVERLAYVRPNEAKTLAPNVDDFGRIIMDSRLLRESYPLYWYLNKHNEKEKRLYHIYSTQYTQDAQRKPGFLNEIHSTWLCLERVRGMCTKQDGTLNTMDAMASRVTRVVQDLLATIPDAVLLPSGMVSTQDTLDTATVACMHAYEFRFNLDHPYILQKEVYDHVARMLQMYRSAVGIICLDKHKCTDTNVVDMIKGYGAVFKLSTHVRRARQRWCSATTIDHLSFVKLHWSTKRLPLPVPKRQPQYAMYLVNDKRPMYFSVINLIHHLTDRIVDNAQAMWERVYSVGNICKYLYGVYVDQEMLRDIHYNMTEHVEAQGSETQLESSDLNTAIAKLVPSMGKNNVENAKTLLKTMRSHLMHMESNCMFLYTVDDLHEYSSQFMSQWHEDITITCSVHANETAVGNIFGSPVYDLVTHLTNHHSHEMDYNNVGRLAMYLRNLGIYVDRTTQRCEPWDSVILVIADILYRVRPTSRFHTQYQHYIETQESAKSWKRPKVFDENTRMVYRHVYPFNDKTVGGDKMATDIMNFVRSCIADRM